MEKKYRLTKPTNALSFWVMLCLILSLQRLYFEKYPIANEGFLTKLRAKVVRGKTLAHLAKQMKINEVMEIGERASGQGIDVSKSVLADLFEAVVAAVYLTKGYDFAFHLLKIY